MFALKTIRRTLIAAVGLSLLAAQPALADQIQVDDDRGECPLADLTSLPAAVGAAAQGDEIYICPGTYPVPGGVGSSGLKIEKNVHLVGAGADEVFVQPDGTAPSMAAATPNERDEFGNVITVKRRLIQLFDVEISGLTVRGAGTAAEAGITMIDVTEGAISDVRVEGIAPDTGPGTGLFAAPPLAEAGDGLIIANTIEDTQNEVTVRDSQIVGFNKTGVIVDNRTPSGTASVGNDSRMIAKIDGTLVDGAGPSAAIDQSGVEVFGSGASLDLTGSVVSDVGAADASEAAVVLHGALVGESVVGGSPADGNDLSAGEFGIVNNTFDDSGLAADTLDATHNWFGALAPGAIATSNVTVTPALSAPPAPPDGFSGPDDDAPTVEWDTVPDPGTVVQPGETVPLAVFADDDFGVAEVEFTADDVSLGVAETPGLAEERVYSGSWTATEADRGKTIVLEGLATDSAGQTSSASVAVSVPALPVEEPPPGEEVPPEEEPPPDVLPTMEELLLPLMQEASKEGAADLRGLGQEGLLNRGGFTVRQDMGVPGKMLVEITGRYRGEEVVIARGRDRIGDDGIGVVEIELTREGRQLLKRVDDAIKVKVHSTFTPTGGEPITIVRTIKLKEAVA